MFSIHIQQLQQVIEFLRISPFSWGKIVPFCSKCPHVIDIALHLIRWPTGEVLLWTEQFVVCWVNGTKIAVVEIIFKVDMESLNNFLIPRDQLQEIAAHLTNTVNKSNYPNSVQQTNLTCTEMWTR
jgi:hypothetical protein